MNEGRLNEEVEKLPSKSDREAERIVFQANKTI